MPTDKLKVLLLPDLAPLAVAGCDLAPDPHTGRREVTGQVNGVVRRYAALVERGAAELAAVLTRAEWNAIADANNGCADIWDWAGDGGPQLSPLTLIRANVADSEGLGAKWDIDQRGLVKKLGALAPHHGEAILSAVRWFWDHCADIDHSSFAWWAPAFRKESLGGE